MNDATREDFKRSFINAAVTATNGAAAYAGQMAQLAISVHDDDAPGVLVLQSGGSTQVVKDDAATAGDQSVPDSYTMRLTQAPVGDVSVAINTDGQVLTAPASLVFNASNWYRPQTVTVTANSAFDPASLPIDPGTQKVWAPQQHLLTKLGGPLSVVGGTLGERALTPAVLLPAELNAPLLQIGTQPDERDQIDTLNIFDDASREDKVGLLSATGLSGFGLAPDLLVGANRFGEPSTFPGGITWGDAATGRSGIEVLNLLMGEGNDTLTITGTLVPADEGRDANRGPARHGTLTTIHGGGNLALTPGGSAISGDTITVTGGGGAGSPLVVYGDTSQDGTWYSGIGNLSSRSDNLVLGPKLFDQVGSADDLFRWPRANPFHQAGNDVIDASALFNSADANSSTLGIVVYGGAGNDTLRGTGAGDHLAGGSGDDHIVAHGGLDMVYGDSGFNVDPITRTLVVVTADAGIGSLAFGAVRDGLVAGADHIDGGSGDDVLFGDHGVAQQDVPRGRVYVDWAPASGRAAVFGYATGNASNSQFSLAASDKLLSTGFIQDLRTAEPGNGGADNILGGAGRDRIFGGNASDVLDGGTESDAVFGDQGHLSYLGADYFGNVETGLAGLGTLDLLESVDTAAAFGAADTITDDASDDILIGGQGGDTIDAGAGQNIVFGDHGRILGVDSGANQPVGAPAGTDDDYPVQVLGLVTSIDWGAVNGAANEFGNGNDSISAGIGRDILIGGGGDDLVLAFASQGGTAALDASNIVFGDHGLVDYLASELLQASALNPLRTDDIDRVWSIAAATRIGGADRISVGNRHDTVIGGTGADAINAGDGHNIVFGDNGQVSTGGVDEAATPFSVHVFTVQTITSIGFLDADNGADSVTSGSGNDVLLGGGAGDTLRAGAGADLVFGDQGLAEGVAGAYLPDLSLPALAPELLLAGQRTLAFTAINTTTNTGSGDDLIHGDDGSDILLGQQGQDTVFAGNGDDIVIGGSNVVGALDADDRLDGGAGHDVVAGDNADIYFRPDNRDVRFATLTGATLYSDVPGANEGRSLTVSVDALGRPLNADPDGVLPAAATPLLPTHREYRIRLLDHSAVLAQQPDNAALRVWGDDRIAGGAQDDELFGQLGDDVIEGDASILGAPVGASISAGGALIVQASVESLASDGDDYIEGGGGNDVVFGNLGQDDIIGGSSSLYGLATPGLRPDGADILFGGAGQRIERDALGTGGESRSSLVAEHAFDADVITGDNAVILRVLGANGQPLRFAYDTTVDIGSDPANPQATEQRGAERIVVRTFDLLDYTPGNDAAAIGGNDLVKAEDGDDIVHGGRGNDVLYGDGWDDDLYGGTGSDRLFGGSGEDGLLGDDGRISTSRNGVAEPLYGIGASTERLIELPGPFTGAVVDLNGYLKKTVNLLAWEQQGGDDTVYGGLGDDFIHGGDGNDALSGAEALAPFYDDVRAATAAPFQYDTVTRKLDFYDAAAPLLKIDNFLLNFDAFNRGVLIEDGKDWIFGDGGHDALVGGTGHDRLFGGLGDDHHQLDDNLDTNGGRNDVTDDATDVQNTGGTGDFAYGGGGLDVLIANTGHDRMFDWTGEFNSFVVPFARFGAPTINRLLAPHTLQFITDLAAAGGADRSLAEPHGEIGLVTQRDPEWGQQHGAPRDPQPGNGHARYDDSGGKEDDRTLAPLQTAHGSTPSGGVPAAPDSAVVQVESAVNAGLALAPTAAEDADLPPGPALAAGTPLVLTYLVRNLSPDGAPISGVSLRDDAGTPATLGDDIVPVYVSGDDGDQLLEVGETWLLAAPAGREAQAGLQRHVATVRGLSAAGNALQDSDLLHYNGNGITTPLPAIRIEKALNAADARNPTATEDADTAPGQSLLIGTPVTWTYQVFNDGTDAIALSAIVDDFGTPALAGDDFTPAAVTVLVGGQAFNAGDFDHDHLIDNGEAWRFTSAGTAAGGYRVVAGAYANLATASGTGVLSGVAVQDSDAAHHIGVATPQQLGVRLEKAVNAANPNAPTAFEDADSPSGPVLTVGSTVVWTYQLFNTGDTAFAVISLRDDAGTVGVSSDDFTPTAVLAAGTLFNQGDADRDNLVDTTEVWLYRASGTVAAGQYANTGLVTVRNPASTAVASSSDLAHHFGSAAGLQVVKAINADRPLAPTAAQDANSATAPVVVAAGSTVVFSYAVRNTGSDALRDVVLVDDAGTVGVPGDDFGPAPVTITAGGRVYNTGDSNKNGLLDRTETWLYSASRVAPEGAYTNIATVSATNARSLGTLRDDDPANLFGALARIDIEKAINAADPAHPTPAEDADSASQPLLLNLGTAITFSYLLRNTGNGALVVNALRDDAATPTVAGDDFTPAALLSGAFNVGDADRDNLLDVGETWRYSSVGTTAGYTLAQSGLHTNLATVTGTDGRTGRTATDSDAASYLGQAGAVRVEKALNAQHPSAPTRYEDADAATGPVLQVGSPTVWTYQIFNQSGAALSILDLVDSDGFAPVYVSGDTDPDGLLGVEEVWLFTSAGVLGAPATALAGQRANSATVLADDANGQRYSDTDLAHYFGTSANSLAGIRIVKAINAADPARPTALEDANDADRPLLLTAGAVPVFSFLVQNLGTRALSGITLVDDAGTDNPADDYQPRAVLLGQRNVGDTDGDGLLDPGETWRYTTQGLGLMAPAAGAHVNVAQVRGTDALSGSVVRDDDQAHYLVTAPAHGVGRMTGGGSVYTEDGNRVTHGFELHCDPDVGPNNLQVNFDGNRFHLEQLLRVACYDDPALNPLPRAAPFDTLVGEGLGRFNGQSGYRIWFTLTDNGEPGQTDFARLEIRDPQGRLLLFVAGNLHNGNHQAHPENKTVPSAMALAEPQPASLTPAGPVSAAAFSIDWAAAPVRAPAAGAPAPWVKPLNWQDRFVSHLGATTQRLDPNAALRLHLAVTPPLAAKLRMLAD